MPRLWNCEMFGQVFRPARWRTACIWCAPGPGGSCACTWRRRGPRRLDCGRARGWQRCWSGGRDSPEGSSNRQLNQRERIVGMSLASQISNYHFSYLGHVWLLAIGSWKCEQTPFSFPAGTAWPGQTGWPARDSCPGLAQLQQRELLARRRGEVWREFPNLRLHLCRL